MELNDELLCAYLDGELDGDRRAQIERALGQDAGGRLRLARMRAADQRLRAEIPLRSSRATDPLAQLISQAETSPVVQPVRMRAWRAALALAASCAALALGFVLARVSGEQQLVADNFASGALQSTLEHSQSGVPLDRATGSASIVLTVVARDGRFCRLYRLRSGPHADLGVTEGVACREDARWRIVAYDATVVSDERFHTAGASALVDGVLDNLGGDPLASAAERAALENNWRGR